MTGKIDIENYLVQQDLYKLLNISMDDISLESDEDGSNVCLVVHLSESEELSYPYWSAEAAMLDWLEIIRINKQLIRI